MPGVRKIVKIFLASPGDLSEERQAVKNTCGEFNDLWADVFGYQVDLLGWEDTVSNVGRPQAIINEELDRCDYFIGMMWKRWGTPPAISGEYSSGFEEEFSRSMSGYREKGKPEISLYFKSISDDRLTDPGIDLQKVLSFKAKIVREKEILFEEFVDTEELSRKILRCVTRYVQRLKQRDEFEQLAEAIPTQVEGGGSSEAGETQSEHRLTEKGAVFLESLVAAEGTSGESGEPSAIEIARLRLLGAALGTTGNDTWYLGAHDSNLLFLAKGSIDLSRREVSHLVDSSLVSFTSQNKPVWYWVDKLGGVGDLVYKSVFAGSDEKKVGALTLMRLIGEEAFAKVDDEEVRDLIIDYWLSENTSERIRIAGLNYLSENGTEQDIEKVDAVRARDNHNDATAATRASLLIRKRISREDAVQFLISSRVKLDDRNIADEILTDLDSIPSGILRSGLDHRSAEVREKILVELNRRGEVDERNVEAFLQDDSPQVRMTSMKILLKSRHFFDDSEVRKLLRSSDGSGLLGLFTPRYDRTEFERIDSFKKVQLSSIPLAKLRELSSKSSLTEPMPKFLLYEREFSKYAQEVRDAVSDRFADQIKMGIEKEKKSLSVGADRIKKYKQSEESIRKNHTRLGLSILSRKGGAQDLPIIRRILASNFIGSEVEDFHFFSRFGEWRDLGLVCLAAQKPHSRLSAGFLSILSDDSEIQYAAADAIVQIAKDRTRDLIGKEIPGGVLAKVIKNLPMGKFRDIPYSGLVKLFNSSVDEVRKQAAMKCVECHSKSKNKEILDRYMEEVEQRYYNTFHWLDLGATMPREFAKRVVRRARETGA